MLHEQIIFFNPAKFYSKILCFFYFGTRNQYVVKGMVDERLLRWPELIFQLLLMANLNSRNLTETMI